MTDITVPELGESIIEGTLTAWLVKEGSSFQAGDNLAEIETEKITIEIPAQSAGTISKILVSEGSSVKVGEVIAQFSQGGESTTSSPSKGEQEETPTPPSKPVEQPKVEKKF
jgi:2-oxoglutarate dehydrogenase E2 component (dihydrolipoamide succinyltransferase)